MGIVLIVLFLFGVLIGVVVTLIVAEAYIQRQVNSRIELKIRELWIEAWKSCVSICLGEWDDHVEKFAERCAKLSIEEWEKTVKDITH